MKKVNTLLVLGVIIISLITAYLLFHQVLGNPSNFTGGDPANEPLSGNYLGVIYKGGPVVIVLIAYMIILVTFVIERLIQVFRAQGKGNPISFIQQAKKWFAESKWKEIKEACDKNQGSVAHVVHNGISTLELLETDESLTHEQKVTTLQKDLEEATQLEIPQLNRNMVIISTLASIATLTGLFGTVTGMIKAFSSLARVGAPDAICLANGISQALVTTALGIATAAVAIVFYNLLSTRIGRIVQNIDESNYSLVHSYKTRAGLVAERPVESQIA
ncbi:MAG TPA: flagellar motor protein MotA [Cytophagales bacterium]|nr:flagellar motor protein MotA [Cytophagales bacterium]